MKALVFIFLLFLVSPAYAQTAGGVAPEEKSTESPAIIATPALTWAEVFKNDQLPELANVKTVLFAPVGVDEALASSFAARMKMLGNRVMLSDSLGDVSKKSDVEIGSASAAYPVDLVVILRNFDDDLLLTTVKTNGELVSTRVLIRSAFKVAAPAEQKETAKSTESVETPKTTSSSHIQKSDELSATERAMNLFSSDFIWFDSWAGAASLFAISGMTNGSLMFGSGALINEPHKGTNGKNLNTSEFYEGIERPDLKEELADNTVTGYGIIVSGAVAIVLGSLWLASAEDVNDVVPGLGGLTVVTSGTVLLFYGLVYDPDPMTSSEKQHAARLHNKNLARRYGFDDSNVPEAIDGIRTGLTAQPAAE